MGQAASSQRTDPRHEHYPSAGIQRTRSSGDRQRPSNVSDVSSSRPTAGSDHVSHPPSGELNTQPSTSSETRPLSTPHATEAVNALQEDGQQQGTALAEFESRNTSGTLMSTTSGRSRQSTMSRLGSRILPNAVVRGLLNSGEETPEEGRAHRNGLFSRVSHRNDGSRNSPRFPSFGNIGSRGINRRRSIREPYSLPRSEPALLPDSPPNGAVIESSSTERRGRSSRFTSRHRGRFSQVRHSIASPLTQMFRQSPPSYDVDRISGSPPRRPSNSGFAEDADHLLPPFVDNPMDLHGPHELDSVEPAARNAQSNSPNSPSRRPDSAGRASQARLLQRDDQPPLSRILHLVATAIAAQLSGAPTGPGIQALGPEGLDGPLESLLQGIQGASSGQADESGQEANNETNNGGGTGSPRVNFLRVFRFVNSDPASGGPSNTQDTTGDRMDVDGQDSTDNENDRRLLTLVVVGVRPMSADNGSRGEENTGGRPNTESILPLISPDSFNFLRRGRGSGGLSRRRDRRSRFSTHRHSMGSAQQRSQTSSRRQSDAGSSGDLAGSLPTVFSESPPGPNPPPSTPAESNLSRVASGANTPSRRPSSASAFLPQLNEDPGAGTEEANAEGSNSFSFSHQRRRSDSEAARHRGLGSGAARRNGVVEPDNPSQSTTRSWLIYVIGTNLAENHPAFATPSLFTDVSTALPCRKSGLYEDVDPIANTTSRTRRTKT